MANNLGGGGRGGAFLRRHADERSSRTAVLSQDRGAGLSSPTMPTLNAVNPGPVDTCYAPPEAYETVRRRFPQGRWGVPDDPARLIAWLVSDEAAWITGQVINTEGGFRRWA